jgi:hypothetical protein
VAQAAISKRGFGTTARRDLWWVEPLFIALGLSGFIVYATWAAFQGNNYYFGNYLSPFYSPEIFGSSPHSWFGPQPAWWPALLPFSPALLILWAPGGFRFTCYYYRGSYYKAMWADPPACAVGEPRGGYRGEKKFPLVIQNIHRYFLYVAMLFALLLTWDAIHSFRDTNGEWGHMGLGTVILLINAALIWAYTLSCHSCRHITGGRLKHFSAHPVRYRAWTLISKLNARHTLLAWASLVWLVVADAVGRVAAGGRPVTSRRS